MKYINLLILMFALTSCGGSSGGGGGGAGTGSNTTVTLDDTLDRVFRLYTQAASDEVKKIEFFSNDTMKITRDDDSAETLSIETRDEGLDDDVNVALSAVCDGASTPAADADDQPLFVDLRLTDSENAFAAILEGIVWEGTCSGQRVECAVILVYETDTPLAQMDNADPDQVYIYDLNGSGGCTPIQTNLETIINNEFGQP